jgi:hypothetical protein
LTPIRGTAARTKGDAQPGRLEAHTFFGIRADELPPGKIRRPALERHVIFVIFTPGLRFGIVVSGTGAW